MKLVTVIQSAAVDAVQLQLEPDVTAIALLLPIAGTETLVGMTVAVQLDPDWLTVTVMPAATIVPTRAAPVVFSATE